jgi:DNA-binding transcriptional LysR family regulator
VTTPIDPNLLLVLATLLKTKSVSATATTLGISQPSASRALSRLRDALRDPLLIRSGTGMTRTRRGDELVDRLADWMASTALLLAEERFDPRSVTRRFRVASTDFGVLAVVLPALPRIREQAPGIAIDIVPLSQATHRALGNGDVDLSISGLDHDPSQVHRQLLFEDRFDCVMPAGHPLDGHEGAIELDDFLAHPHLGLTVSDAELDRVTVMLGTAGRDRHVAASVPYFLLAPELLAAGNLLVTMPGRAAAKFRASHGLAVRPAPIELGRLSYWVLWHERTHRDPASEWLRAQLADAGRAAE